MASSFSVLPSASSRAFRPPWGMEKGLWQNSRAPDSSPISYMGKSTIQHRAYCSSSKWPGTRLPSMVRITPAVFWAAAFLPAAMQTKEPGFRFSFSVRAGAQSPRNLEMPPVRAPFSSTLNQQALLPVWTSTSARSLSIHFRAWAKLSTLTALTVAPSKGPKPQPWTRSEISWISRSIRRSGLSEP